MTQTKIEILQKENIKQNEFLKYNHIKCTVATLKPNSNEFVSTLLACLIIFAYSHS